MDSANFGFGERPRFVDACCYLQVCGERYDILSWQPMRLMSQRSSADGGIISKKE